MGADAADREASTTRVNVGFGTALAVVAAAGVAVVLAGLVSAASRPLGWALACAVVAALVSPIVDLLDRHVPRALAMVAVLLGLALLFGAVWGGLAATVADNVEALSDDAPAAAASLEGDHQVARDFRLKERVDGFVEEMESQAGASAQLRRTPATLSTYLVTGILVLFLIGYGPKLVAGALRQVADEERQRRVAEVGAAAVQRWRRYVWATAAQAIAVTLVAWGAFYALDLPGPFVLGLLVGALSAIPMFGMLVGAIPAMLVAAGFDGLGTAAAVAGFVLVLQILEITVVHPRVDARTVEVGAAVFVVVALLGYELYGIGGAVYAGVLTVLVLAVLDALEQPDAQPDEVAAPLPGRAE